MEWIIHRNVMMEQAVVVQAESREDALALLEKREGGDQSIAVEELAFEWLRTYKPKKIRKAR